VILMNKPYAELKKKSASELEKDLAAVKFDLIKLEAQLATGAAAKEAGKIRNLKKNVARIKTLLNEQRRAKA